MKITINKNEEAVLKSLVEESNMNGHDFGFADGIVAEGLSKRQVSGYISALVAKDLIRITDDEYRQTMVRPSAIKHFEPDYDFNHGYWSDEDAWVTIEVK